MVRDAARLVWLQRRNNEKDLYNTKWRNSYE